MLPERGWSSACRLRASGMDVPTPCPETANGLRSQGYSWPPTASRVNLLNQGTSREHRASEARQAAQSGDVSREGRSLRSSPSAGEPRTWRREAVGEYGIEAAGESHVCGIQLRSGLALEQATEAVRAMLPDFASTSMESPVHSERCTPGSERGARKPTGASR
jgi:hypothetical protein